jgi:hypothetical protein
MKKEKKRILPKGYLVIFLFIELLFSFIFPIEIKFIILFMTLILYLFFDIKNKNKLLISGFIFGLVFFLICQFFYKDINKSILFWLYVLITFYMFTLIMTIYDKTVYKRFFFSFPGSRIITLLGVYYLFIFNLIGQLRGVPIKNFIRVYDHKFNKFLDETFKNGFEVVPIKIRHWDVIIFSTILILLNGAILYEIPKILSK